LCYQYTCRFSSFWQRPLRQSEKRQPANTTVLYSNCSTWLLHVMGQQQRQLEYCSSHPYELIVELLRSFALYCRPMKYKTGDIAESSWSNTENSYNVQFTLGILARSEWLLVPTKTNKHQPKSSPCRSILFTVKEW
jgi:hypothetical protein